MNNERIYYSHDAEMQALRERTVLTLIFLVFGLSIGAVLAAMFTPSSGKTARHDLAKSVEEGLNAGRETVDPLWKRIEGEFADLRKSIGEHLK